MSTIVKAFVVDDDPENRARVRSFLEPAGFEVTELGTADDAAATLTDPDCRAELVVTDVQMPGTMDGIDLAALLASARPELPVVVMSASRFELNRAGPRGLMVPTLEKPIHREPLLAAVRDASNRRPRGSRQSPHPASGARRRPAIADAAPILARMFREADRAGHPHVGSEHVALAALDGPGGFKEIAVGGGLDPDALRPALLTCCHEPAAVEPAGLTFGAARLIATASQMALLDLEPGVGARHLIQALLGAPQAMAWAGLAAAGLDHATAMDGFRRQNLPGVDTGWAQRSRRDRLDS